MIVGFLFLLFNCSRKLLKNTASPARKKKKKLTLGIFVEVIEMYGCLLPGLPGTCTVHLTGQLGLHPEEMLSDLLQCLLWCLHSLSYHLSRGKQVQENVPSGSPIAAGGKRPAQHLSFLSVSDVYSGEHFGVVACQRHSQILAIPALLLV